MNPTRWDRIQDLFHQAAGLDGSEQRAYLESACGGDHHLVSAVLAMLDEDRRDASLLQHDLPEVAHSLLSNSTVPQSFGPYRIQKVLGYKPIVSLEEGLRRTVEAIIGHGRSE